MPVNTKKHLSLPADCFTLTQYMHAINCKKTEVTINGRRYTNLKTFKGRFKQIENLCLKALQESTPSKDSLQLFAKEFQRYQSKHLTAFKLIRTLFSSTCREEFRDAQMIRRKLKESGVILKPTFNEKVFRKLTVNLKAQKSDPIAGNTPTNHRIPEAQTSPPVKPQKPVDENKTEIEKKLTASRVIEPLPPAEAADKVILRASKGNEGTPQRPKSILRREPSKSKKLKVNFTNDTKIIEPPKTSEADRSNSAPVLKFSSSPDMDSFDQSVKLSKNILNAIAAHIVGELNIVERRDEIISILRDIVAEELEKQVYSHHSFVTRIQEFIAIIQERMMKEAALKSKQKALDASLAALSDNLIFKKAMFHFLFTRILQNVVVPALSAKQHDSEALLADIKVVVRALMYFYEKVDVSKQHLINACKDKKKSQQQQLLDYFFITYRECYLSRFNSKIKDLLDPIKNEVKSLGEVETIDLITCRKKAQEFRQQQEIAERLNKIADYIEKRNKIDTEEKGEFVIWCKSPCFIELLMVNLK